jgi:dipeptidyl aminopeptidase/acylaminoacyl peptidase
MLLRTLSILAITCTLALRAERTPLTAMDVFELELATSPQISADGKRIVYTRESADVMTDKRYSNLWMVRADGTDHRPLTSGKYRDTNPIWSEDGNQITFISDRDGTPQIWRLWSDTGHIAKITNLISAPASLALSPDGKWIAFTMHVAAKDDPIVRMPKPPEGAKWADPAKVIDSTIYRFNAAGFLKPGYNQIFVVSAEGGTPRQISDGKFQHGGPASFPGSSTLEWSRDSKSVLFGVNRTDVEKDAFNTEIYEFPIADGPVRALTSRKGPDTSPVVSPDGRYIAYLGFDDRFLGHQITRISVMNRDGSAPRVLTPKLDLPVASVAWAPDSKGVYFVADERGNTGLFYTPLDGAVKKLTGDLGSTRSASAVGAAISVAKTGAIAFTHTRPDRPGDIAVLPPGGGSPRILTAVNEDFLGGRKLGAVEEIWYESSKDARKIHGWIIKPPDFDSSKKYPLILEIHGGPFANYGDRFDLEKQLMVASGYVVLYTNPRGSTSYGEDFANLIHHAYPGDDFYDLNSGVDAMLAKGYIDPEQLYVTGGSGGGVLTCWMIGRTPRFRAAVTVYPVINWYSWLLTSDIGPVIGRYWFPGMPWDNVEHYEKRSLLSVVKNVKTPTMVLTGEADYRTPMSDSEQYYQALRMLGVETVLVRVPDEPHGIAVRPSHHISKILHIISWFDRHRQPEAKISASR